MKTTPPSFALICILLLRSSLPSAASASTGDVLEDLANDFVSPVTTDARWILLGGSVATAMAYATQRSHEYRKRETFDEARPLGRFGFLGHWVGYGILNASYVLIHGGYGLQKDDEEALREAEHMFRASAMAVGTTGLLKSLVHERRPGYPDDPHSFPSGHSSASFAFAGVVTIQHGWGWGAAAHAMASYIAISRIDDDFHYLHDVMAGMTLGAAYAWGVHYQLENKPRYWFSIAPLPQGIGAMIGTRF